MSDYLWDKTGEAEEDVERLEELLGSLRFQPRTFEVPAIMPVAPRRTLARNSFTWQRLAVAASLLLMLLAGAWLVATRQRTNDGQQVAGANPTPVTATPQPRKQEVAGTNNNQTTAPTRGEKREAFESIASHNSDSRRRREASSQPVKHNEPLPRQSNVPGVNAPREEIATTSLSPEEREAMAKFLLAMKVTSEKLNYAERQMASVNR